jgi:hypothetical protein
MGYYINHTIVVVSMNADALREARDFAASTGADVSEIVRGKINGSASFFVAPDGSKEGWTDSDCGDMCRAQIKAQLRATGYPLAWFEVAHPEDGAPQVIDHQDHDENPNAR